MKLISIIKQQFDYEETKIQTIS